MVTDSLEVAAARKSGSFTVSPTPPPGHTISEALGAGLGSELHGRQNSQALVLEIP